MLVSEPEVSPGISYLKCTLQSPYSSDVMICSFSSTKNVPYVFYWRKIGRPIHRPPPHKNTTNLTVACIFHLIYLCNQVPLPLILRNVLLVHYMKFTLMWNLILNPSWLRNELSNYYYKYSNDLDDIDTWLINVAYMKFARFCVHSIKNYWRMSKCCVSFFAGYIWIHQRQIHLYNCCFERSNMYKCSISK